MFKNPFKSKEADKEEIVIIGPSVAGLCNGGAFIIDNLELKLLADKLVFETPDNDQIISSVGQVQLDHNSFMYRFYVDDQTFLQIITEDGNAESDIQDIKFYQTYDSFGVCDEDEWIDALENNIVREEFGYDDEIYTPVWQVSDPVQMIETLFLANGNQVTRENYCMLYEREVQKDFFEFAYVVGEEAGQDGDNRTAKLLVGVNLQLTEINIIG